MTENNGNEKVFVYTISALTNKQLTDDMNNFILGHNVVSSQIFQARGEKKGWICFLYFKAKQPEK